MQGFLSRYKRFLMRVALLGCMLTVAGRTFAQSPEPIRDVTIGPNREVRVNGRPFLPIMSWLQDPVNFPAVRNCGMNTTAGYWRGSGGTRDVAEYLDRVREAGLYGVMPYDDALRGHPALLAYIHDDEPDLPRQVSDGEVIASPGLRINSKTPLWRIRDGDTSSWSVLDPLAEAAITIPLPSPVTVRRFSFWLTTSPGLSVAREIEIQADGNTATVATLENRRGEQAIELPEPVTASRFTFRVTKTDPGDNEWGSIAEIGAYDKDGKNVLLAPPRWIPRQTPEQTAQAYQRIRQGDANRPVFMTFTGYFHPHFGKWPDEVRSRLYPAYIASADVVGFDIYPIYGWNKPEWIHLVYEATAQLTDLAGNRPTYAWIETGKGGQYTGALENQKDVTPRHIEAEVWMALCGGATGIGYFTHIWKPSYNQFGVPAENREALRRINDRLTRLTPAILAPRHNNALSWTTAGGRVAAFLTVAEDAVYVFAVNYDPKDQPADVVFSLNAAGLPTTAAVADGTVAVVIDENRGVLIRDGKFSDHFEPLGVHLYRIQMGEKTRVGQ